MSVSGSVTHKLYLCLYALAAHIHRYRGRMCSKCALGYYRQGQLCLKCVEGESDKMMQMLMLFVATLDIGSLIPNATLDIGSLIPNTLR